MKTHPNSIVGRRLLWSLLVTSGLALDFAVPSARGEVVIDGDLSDWDSIGIGGGATGVAIDDPSDLPDPSGDIRQISASVDAGDLVLTMTVEGIFTPAIDQTTEGKVNRYYYHWIFDTDNDPSTGLSNEVYEDTPTNVATPIGTELVIQIGWRDGAPDGVYAYDPLTEEAVALDYEWAAEGSTATARIPLEVLGFEVDQTVAFSAFQEGASDDWLVDWMESTTFTIPGSEPGPALVFVDDGQDLPDTSGDIRRIEAHVLDGNLHLSMTVEGIITPSVDQTPEGKTNRYYYHWLLDTDNDPSTGSSNEEYEGSPTNVATPIGAELVVQIGWRDGAPDGVYVYVAGDDDNHIVDDYAWTAEGSTARATLPLETLGLVIGQTIGLSAFQEGASDDWLVDWLESTNLAILDSSGTTTTILHVEDPIDDLPDPSGDLKRIQAAADDTYLYLGMEVEGIISPSVAQTPEGKTNRYYYHWLLDTDNDPSTGSSNEEYEGSPTNVATPIGAELVVQIGWRDGAPDGVYVYVAGDDDNHIVDDYEWAANGAIAEARLPLATLGLTVGQRIALSAFQEGASDDWLVDWMESGTLTIVSPSSGQNIDLTTFIDASAYGYAIRLEDREGAALVEESVRLLVDGTPIESTVEADGDGIVVSAVNPEWLPSDSTHRLRIEYQIEGLGSHFREFPFEVPPYTAIPTFYAASTVDQNAVGFRATITQVSEAQADSESYHGNNAELAERQFQGLATSRDGVPFFNEAGTPLTGWNLNPLPIEGVINWHELAPAETGHFRQSKGRTDMPIPNIPGSEGSTNGIVAEVLAFLELEPGFHRFGINTVTGFRATIGPDGRDRLAPVLGEFSGERNYSTFGDHFFSILVEEPGYYPLRLLWFHAEPTNESAQLEFYSIKNKKRILINDPDDPDAIKAFRASPSTAPYVSAIDPPPGYHFATNDTLIEIKISEEGAAIVPNSIELAFNGTKVIPVIEKIGAVTTVAYDPGPLTYGSTHVVEIAYQIDGQPPTERRESYTFGVYDQATTLSTDWVTPVGSEGPPGFKVRSVQSFSARSNSTAAAEAQLAGNGDFSTESTIDAVNLSNGQSGLFPEDTEIIGGGLVSDANANYFSMEVIAYLYLTVGIHTMGINSDDGFKITTGKSPTEETVLLASYEGGRGTDSTNPQDLFDVIVQEEGLYAFRLVWYQGTGDASLEWYSYDRTTGEIILLNDPEHPEALAAYQSRTEEPGAKPGPNIAVTRDYEFRRIAKSQASVVSAFPVLNSGNANTLTISEARFTGPDAGYFSVSNANALPLAIAPKETGVLSLTFAPNGAVGTFFATLEIASDDADEADRLKTISVVAHVIDPNGPTAHYKLDETEGTVMNDVSGYWRTGRFEANQGNLSLGEPSLAGGTSVDFAGGAYAVVDGGSLENGTEFSVSTWIQATSLEDTQMIFGRANPAEANPVFSLLMVGGTLNWFVGENVEFSTDAAVIAPATPYHIGVAYRKGDGADDGYAALYVDGVEVARQTAPAELRLGTGSHLYLGSLRGVLPFGGRIDDFQIYNRALSTADLAYLHENPSKTLGDRDGVIPSGDLPPITDLAIDRASGAIGFAFGVPEGNSIAIEYSETLEPGSWEIILPGVSGNHVFLESDPGRLAKSTGFYRLRNEE